MKTIKRIVKIALILFTIPVLFLIVYLVGLVRK